MARCSKLALVFALVQVSLAAPDDDVTLLQVSVQPKAASAAKPARSAPAAVKAKRKLANETERAAPGDLEDGSDVEIVIQSGAQAGTWVPAIADRKRFTNYYDISLVLGPNDRYVTFLAGVSNSLLRRPHDAKTYKGKLQYYVDYPDKAKQATADLEFDAMKRNRDALSSKGLNKTDVQARLAVFEKTLMKKKEQFIRAKGCPEGYKEVDGDVRGGSQFTSDPKKPQKQDALDLCGLDCDQRPGCKSFEYSPSTKVCNLNKVAEPQRTPHFLDFIFCQSVK